MAGNIRDCAMCGAMLLLADDEWDALRRAALGATFHFAPESRVTDGAGTLFDRVERFERDAILTALQQNAKDERSRPHAGPGAQPSVQKCQQLGIRS